MSANTGVVALWEGLCTTQQAPTNTSTSNNGNIVDIGIVPSPAVPAGKDFGLSGYGEHLVLLNPHGTYIAEYAILAQDLSPGRHSVRFSDGTCFSYTVAGGALANADALISAINVNFDVE